jgi:hypothetical protein
LFPPANFGDFVDITRDALTIPADVVADDTFVNEFNQAVTVRFYDTKKDIVYGTDLHAWWLLFCFSLQW